MMTERFKVFITEFPLQVSQKWGNAVPPWEKVGNGVPPQFKHCLH